MIAAAGSQDKIDVAVHLGGADHGVNYTQPDWQQEVLKLTGGKGVDVIYDPVGMIKGLQAPHVLKLRAERLCRLLEMHRVERESACGGLRSGADREGMLVDASRQYSTEAHALGQLPLNLVLLKNISIVGIHWGAYASECLALAHSSRRTDAQCRFRDEAHRRGLQSYQRVRPFPTAPSGLH